jgi:CheY-like chemotaxis protein
VANTILIVDDSATIRNIIKVYFAGTPWEFVDAESGTRALQLVRLMAPRIAIVDINMEGMDGLTFTRKLRESDRLAMKMLPVILLTSDRTPDVRERGLAAGAQDLLHKPVAREALRDLVEKYAPLQPVKKP